MRANTTKQLALLDKLAIGTMCNLASPLAAETLGHCGYDFIVVDLQHGEAGLDSVQPLLQAISSTPTIPIVRVPALNSIYIQRVLDLGAYGVIVPLINTADEAKAVVDNACYPPLGVRSWGPTRATMYGGADYFSKARDEILTLVMIESAEGLSNAKVILEVDGVDGCFVGPADLNISLGNSADDPSFSARTEEGIAEIALIARSLGKIAAIHTTSASDAQRRAEQGYRVITVMADTRLIRMGAQQTQAPLRA